MRTARSWICLAGVCLAATFVRWPGDAVAIPQQPTFQSTTTLVEVSAVVTVQGQVVPDLSIDDVRLLDNGVAQPLVVFEYVDSAAERSATKGSDFAIVFDDLSIEPRLTRDATEVVSALIDELDSADRLAIVNTGPFEQVQQLSTDREASRRLLHRLRGQKGASPASFTPLQRCHDTVTALRVVERAATVMGGAQRERKAIVVISEGHRVHWVDSSRHAIRCDEARTAYERVVGASALANVAIYGVDIRGLMAHAPGYSGSGGAKGAVDHANAVVKGANAAFTDIRYGSLGLMATSTGGALIAERNDMADAVLGVVRDSRQYYRLAYVQPDIPPEERGTLRRIEVKVSRPGVEVRARRSYAPR